VLTDERVPASAEEAAEHQRDDHDVVELTGHRDEVRHEITGERKVARERDEQRLLPASTRGSLSSRPQRTTHSGMKPARARALSFLSAMTRARTAAA
jgi:hypothetical protein